MGIEESFFDCSENISNETINNTNNSNYNFTDCDSFLGNTTDPIFPYVTFSISLIGFILNAILILKYFICKEKDNSRKQSSMKLLFTLLYVLDCITSLYWMISSIIFKQAYYINKYYIYCFILSIVYFTVYTFEFIFINFILVHFRNISLNPIEGILQPGKNIKKYFAFSFIGTSLITGTAICLKVLGRSVMNTCFINTKESQQEGLIFLIPIFLTFLAVFQILYDLKCRKLFLSDRQVREAYKLNSMYVLVFSLLHIPMFLLVIITSAREKVKNDNNDNNDPIYETILKHFSPITTFLTCSIPMIIGIIRNCRGFTRIKKVKEIQRTLSKKFNSKNKNLKMKRTFRKSINEPLNLDESFDDNDQFDWLEKHAMQFFMRDIFLGIAHCIYKSKSYGTNIYLEDSKKESEDLIRHNICFENFKLNDITVNQSQYLDVNIIEYAPKIFAYLRNLEHIDIKEMVNSFLPINNKLGISESQGKSGSFFLSTDDNQYMIKTLRVDEFDLIRTTFLNQYVKYLTNNKSSLLCRIYGMYNIIMSGGDEILIIVMRNVIGEFKNNIIAQYDLKGSSKNRISDFDMDKSSVSTMKDLNFDEYEQGIMISNKNINRLREITKYDSLFLCQMELMDYSLFLVKLTLTSEQAKDLFGEDILEKQEIEFNNLIEESTVKSHSDLLNYEQDIKINYDQDFNKDEFKGRISISEKGEKFKNIKYYKQYIFPSLKPGSAYILAIIDYFQMFNFYKYIESGLKTKFGKKKAKAKISCVDPKTYSSRFIKYFEKITNIKHILLDGQKTDESNLENNSKDKGNKSKSNKGQNNGSNIELGLMAY